MKVYLITNGHNEYKIGYTNRPISKRLMELQTASPYKLEIINFYESDNSTTIEKTLHRRFASKNASGEWFSLDLKDVNNFVNECKRIDSNLKMLDENKILPDDIQKFIN